MKPYTILVPFDQSEGAAEMLCLACQVAVMRGGTVVVLAMTEVHRALPLHDLPAFMDEKSENAVIHAVALARQFDVKTESYVRRTYDPAKTIVEQAYISQSDAIFFAPKQPKFFRLLPRLGGDARFVFLHAPCPVLFGHLPFPSCLDATDVVAEADRIVSHVS